MCRSHPRQLPYSRCSWGALRQPFAAQRELAAAGSWVVAIRPPTVPAGSARLRVSLSAAHTEAEVDALAEQLGEVCACARSAEV